MIKPLPVSVPSFGRHRGRESGTGSGKPPPVVFLFAGGCRKESLRLPPAQSDASGDGGLPRLLPPLRVARGCRKESLRLPRAPSRKETAGCPAYSLLL